MMMCLSDFWIVFLVFRFFSGLQNGTRKAAQTGRRRTLKTYGNRFRDSFSIGGASRRAGAEKTLATLRSELPRTLIYGVLSRQNVTFRLFALVTKTFEKVSPELPVGPPDAFMFNES